MSGASLSRTAATLVRRSHPLASRASLPTQPRLSTMTVCSRGMSWRPTRVGARNVVEPCRGLGATAQLQHRLYATSGCGNVQPLPVALDLPPPLLRPPGSTMATSLLHGCRGGKSSSGGADEGKIPPAWPANNNFFNQSVDEIDGAADNTHTRSFGPHGFVTPRQPESFDDIDGRTEPDKVDFGVVPDRLRGTPLGRAAPRLARRPRPASGLDRSRISFVPRIHRRNMPAAGWPLALPLPRVPRLNLTPLPHCRLGGPLDNHFRATAPTDQWLGKLEDDRQKEMSDEQEYYSSSGLEAQPASTHRTLMYSLGGNVVIAGAKFYAFSRTGSSAMFSEAIHTLVRAYVLL